MPCPTICSVPVGSGKHVQLEVIGEPLPHLIRNAVDHGIESAQERLAAGKPTEGTLILSAEQRSGRIVIPISDDGKGIDRTRVLAKAAEKGLVAADAQLSREEIDNLIFAPGFQPPPRCRAHRAGASAWT